MSEKVLFVCPSNDFQKGRIVHSDSRLGMEHLGLLYLQSLLTEKGFNTKTIDFNFEEYHGKQKTLDEQINLILQENPSIVGFSPYFTSIENTIKMAESIKKSRPETKIILGGSHASHTANELLEHNLFIDAVFLGESFGTIEKIINKRLHAENLENISGIAYRKNGKIVNNGFGNLVDLDSLPFPSRSEEFYKLTKTAGIMFSQGCVGKCTFCPTGNLSSHPRFRSLENVVDEIEELVEKFGINTIETHSDDSFGLAKNAVEYYSSFAKELLNRKLNVNWRAVLRASDFGNGRLVNEKFWKLLSDSGLESVYLGFEAGTDERLRKLRKPSNVETNKKAFDFLTKQGILVNYGFIMFFPDSTLGEVSKNMDFLHSINSPSYFDYSTSLMLLPGSEIFNDYKREGKLSEPIYLPQKYLFLDESVRKIQRAYSLHSRSQAEIDVFCKDLLYTREKNPFLEERAEDLYSTGKKVIANPDSAQEILSEFDLRWREKYEKEKRK